MNDKRKRTAPTIDLTASEVPVEPSKAAASPETPQSAPSSELPPQSAAETEASPPQPPPEQAQPEPAHEEPIRPRGAGILTAAIAGGIVGAALLLALVVALWFAGLLPLQTTSSSDARLADLQKQIEDLQKRPPFAIDNRPLAALSQRVDKIESEIAKSPPSDKTVTARLAAADNAMKSLGVALAALNKRSDATAKEAAQAQASAQAAEKAVNELRASMQTAAKQAGTAIDPAKLDALRQRVAALEQSVKAAQAKIAETSATDNTARLALSALALRAAVTSGAPYQTELKQAKALGGDAKVLAPLETFAATGLPRQIALAYELRALMPALRKAAGAQNTPKSFLARMEANAGKLVRISPVNAPPGNNVSAILARLDVEVAHADITAARADLDKLPAAARTPAQGWIAKVTARRAALDAARQFASDMAKALGKPAGAAAPGKS